MSTSTETQRQGLGLAATAIAVVVFLQIPVLVVVLAAFSKTAYLTIPPKGLTLHWFEVVPAVSYTHLTLPTKA